TLTLDSTAVNNLSQPQITDALSVLGGPYTRGLLRFSSNTLNNSVDPTEGVIASEAKAFQNQNVQDQQQIARAQARITLLQANLQAQMAKADALIATLQQQDKFLQGLFQFNTSNNPNGSITG